MQIKSYQIDLVEEKEGGYTVLVPELPGCVSFGKTIEDAKTNAKEAIKLHLDNLNTTHMLNKNIEKRKINEYTAVIKQDNDCWIGWIEEVTGVNCQEKTRKGLLDTLRLTLGEILELNKEDARQFAGNNFQEVQITV